MMKIWIFFFKRTSVVGNVDILESLVFIVTFY